MSKIRLLDACILLVIILFMGMAPYTKVEESFNIQAIHDILNHGFYPYQVVENNYDHISFPGAVPRSFVGSLVIAAIAKAVLFPLSLVGIDLMKTGSLQLTLQKLVRGILGLANGLMLIRFRDQLNQVVFIERKHRRGVTGFWFTLLVLSQFHLLFYSSRTLPNFIALPVVNFAFSKLISGDITGLTWLAFVGVVLRLEVGILGGIIALMSSVGFGNYSFSFCTFLILSGAFVGLGISFFVDSYFWGRLCVPELEAFYFNVVQGNASQWGAHPFSAYFTELLWKLFKPPIVLLLLPSGLLSDPADDGTNPFSKKTPGITHPSRNSLRILTISCLIYVFVMSFQPHKEWRFIIYVVPVFMMLAANALASFQRQASKGFLSKLLVFVLFVGICSSILLSFLMSFVSSFNYPGGDVIEYANRYMLENPGVAHLDVEPCMTGITKFTEVHSPSVQFDKTEDVKNLVELWDSFSLLVTEKRLSNRVYNESSISFDGSSWTMIYSAKKFDAITVRPFIFLLQQNQKDKSVLPAFLLQVLNELTHGRIDTVKHLLEALVVRLDYLYVYKRITPDSQPASSNRLIKEPVNENENVEEATDLDFEKVGEELNNEIDDLEGVHTA